MDVITKETENALVITLEGKMMLGYEANDFHEAIENAIERNKKKIVVDLSNVQFISSWGIGILMYGYTLEKTKLEKIFAKYASVKEALKS